MSSIKNYKKNYWILNLIAYICTRMVDSSNRPGWFRGQTTTVMATLKYTTREINRNFKIKVSGMYEGKKVNTLVGVTGLCRMVDDIELTGRLLDRAFSSSDDKCVCKLRRGIKVSFYFV